MTRGQITRRPKRGFAGKRPVNVLQFHTKPLRKPGHGPKPNTKWPVVMLIASPLIGIAAAWLWNNPPASAENLPLLSVNASVVEQYHLTFSACAGSSRYTCVVDGDTFWLEGQKVRIADINTPEVSEPQCAEEARLGGAATQRLISLLNASSFSLETVDREEDDYGRKLRIVTRGGESLGDMLVEEGLAERWQGRRGSWC